MGQCELKQMRFVLSVLLPVRLFVEPAETRLFLLGLLMDMQWVPSVLLLGLCLPPASWGCHYRAVLYNLALIGVA